MEHDSCSMTPPHSPILQAGMFEEDMIIPDNPLKPDNLKSSSVLFCCQGEPQSYSNTHSDSLLHKGMFERFQRCSFDEQRKHQHMITLFEHQFDFDTAFTEYRQTVFSMARSAFSELEAISQGANFVHVGDSSDYVRLRRDLRSFFDCLLQWLKCKKTVVAASCISPLLDDLLLMSVFVGRLRDLPISVLSQAASRQGNRSSCAGFHFFHLSLEMHCALIEAVYALTLLYPEELMNNVSLCRCRGDGEMLLDPTTELIQLLLWDVVSLAAHTHNKISTCDYQKISPFPCSCVREVTIILTQLMSLRQQKQAKQSFWVCLTAILMQLLNNDHDEDETMEIDSYSNVLPFAVNCRDPVGFSWWFVVHVAPLYNYNELGIYSQSQVPTPSNYYLLQQLTKRSITENESGLRLHLRCCLTITSDWEPNAGFVGQLWEHFYKKLNESFRTQTSDMMGHACMMKSASSLYENCQRLAENNLQGLNQDGSFQLFLRLLAQYLTKSGQPLQAWRQLKGRFYSKFHARRIQELTDIGLQNLATLFIVLGYVADTPDICDKLVELLMCGDALTAARQAAVWRGVFALVHLHQHKHQPVGYITEKLASSFEPIARELSECTDVSQASVVWGLVSLYLDSTTDVLERSERLCDQEYKLIGPALHLLLSKANSTELKTLLAFLHTTIHKIRSLSQISGASLLQESGVLGLSDRLWQHSYSFIKQHSTTQTPPGMLADVATGFCLLSLTMPPTVQTGMKEDFNKVFTYFSMGPQVNPVVSCRFLCHTLVVPAIQNRLSVGGEEQEVNLIQAWFRSHWYLLSQSESLQQLTRLMCERTLLAGILKTVERSAGDQPIVCQFLAGLGLQYAALQDLRSKMAYRDKVERYIGDINRHLAIVLKNCGSSELTRNIYFLAGHLVKFCANIIYSNTKPLCILPPLVDKLILPRSLVVQGKELAGNVVAALKSHLHLFVSGFGCLDYRTDPYIQRKIKEMFTFYFTKFPMGSTAVMSATHVHPFVAAICDDVTGFRQYIIQIVTQEHLSARMCSTQGLSFVLELFRKSKSVNIARDGAVLLSPLLTQLIENAQQRSHLSHAVCCLLEALRTNPQILSREELVRLVTTVIEKQIPVHTGRVFRSMEGVVQSHTELFIDLIPTMTGIVKMSEMKRGLGKDKQLRVAYVGLLQKLGDHGNAEKSKILMS